MKKLLKGLSRRNVTQEKVHFNDCICNIIKALINEIDYKVDIKVILNNSGLSIILNSLLNDLELDIARSFNVQYDKLLPSLCRISKIVALKIEDIKGIKNETIDFSKIEDSIIEINEEKIEGIKRIELFFNKKSMDELFSKFIYDKGNWDIVKKRLIDSFTEAIKCKKVEITVMNTYHIQKLKSITSGSSILVRRFTTRDKTIIEIRKSKEKNRKINIYVNDVLYNCDNNDRYVNWRKKPFRKDGYTFVDLIIEIKFYINGFNLNHTEMDKVLFNKVRNEVELLIEGNKGKFSNPNININYEEKKSELNYLMHKTGYVKYTNLVMDLTRAIIKAEKDGHKILSILKRYL